MLRLHWTLTNTHPHRHTHKAAGCLQQQPVGTHALLTGRLKKLVRITATETEAAAAGREKDSWDCPDKPVMCIR